MVLHNHEVLQYTDILIQLLKQPNLYIPAKANFYIQRNVQQLCSIAQNIEEVRQNIIKKYGQPIEDAEKYYIPKENIEEANTELNELLEATQELSISKFLIDDLKNVELTPQQMQALMFMIEE